MSLENYCQVVVQFIRMHGLRIMRRDTHGTRPSLAVRWHRPQFQDSAHARSLGTLRPFDPET